METQINFNLLKTCTDLRAIIQQSETMLNLMEQPKIADKQLIPDVYKLLQEHFATTERMTALRAEMLILLYLFAPSVLTQKHAQTNETFAAIYDTMGIKRSNAYFYKKNVLDFYKIYQDFRETVDSGMRLVCQHYPTVLTGI